MRIFPPKILRAEWARAITHLVRRSSTQTGRLELVFLGTDDFSRPILDALYCNSSSNSGVIGALRVVTVKGPKRPYSVERYCIEKGIPCSYWPLPSDQKPFDVGVVASFGHIIPSRIIRLARRGILNVHPSLLPRWRGASPIPYTILHGDTITGITIIEIRPKVDAGPILMQKAFPVPDGCTARTLCDHLADRSRPMIVDCLQRLDELRAQAREQDLHGVTHAPKLDITKARVCWSDETASSIERKFRAFDVMVSLRSSFQGKPVRFTKLCQGQPDAPEPHSAPGEFFYEKKTDAIWIRCKDSWLGVKELVFRKSMSAKAFYNGYLSKLPPQRAIFQ